MEALPKQKGLFSILDRTDSTNNYAAARIHAGLAKNGEGWYARDQFAGRGQRGKTWKAAPGENVFLSVAVRPGKAFAATPFLLSVLAANSCRDFLGTLSGEIIKVKWPNDLYWRDNKTGGILIENIYKGNLWDWAIIGIGINVNQTVFDVSISNAASLKMITGRDHDPAQLAEQLHGLLLNRLENIKTQDLPAVLKTYNDHLYKKGERIKLKKDNAVFETTVTGVNQYGQLMTEDVLQRLFEVGEVALLHGK